MQSIRPRDNINITAIKILLRLPWAMCECISNIYYHDNTTSDKESNSCFGKISVDIIVKYFTIFLHLSNYVRNSIGANNKTQTLWRVIALFIATVEQFINKTRFWKAFYDVCVVMRLNLHLHYDNQANIINIRKLNKFDLILLFIKTLSKIDRIQGVQAS